MNPARFGAPHETVMRKPIRSPLNRLFSHVRDLTLKIAPLYLRSRTGFLIRITRRTELRIYERMFVEDMFPIAALDELLSGRKGVVIFDIGACFGYFSLSALDRHPSADVHIFEANPHVIKIIEHHRDINGIKGWIINHGAVGVSDEAVDFYLTSTPLVASLNLSKAKEFSHRGKIQVPGIRLGNYCKANNISRIDIMKLDVEGFEEEVIASSIECFAMVQALFIRIFPPHSVLTRVSNLLFSVGFSLEEGALNHQNEYLFIRRGSTVNTTPVY